MVPVFAAMSQPEDVGWDPEVGMRLGGFQRAEANVYVQACHCK